MADWLDLNELAREYEELEEQNVTCPVCKGEGVLEVEAGSYPNDPEYDDGGERTCPKCDGDGEYVPNDKFELPEDDYERWNQLDALNDEVNGLSELAQNESHAISEYDFEDYARQLAEDIGAMPEGNAWPVYCIDWEWAARELQHDYTSFDFEDTTYLVRSY